MLRWFVLVLFVGFSPAFLPAERLPAEEAAAPKTSNPRTEEEYYELYRMLAETIDEVERNYVEEIDRRELMEAAIEGIIGKLDQYSSYISPEDLSGFRTSVESQFGGIGIQVSMDAEGLQVISPLVDTPAYRAGIRAGDRIVKIDDEPTKGMSLDEAIKTMKGLPGTEVRVSVRHVDDPAPEELTLKREIIHVKTVLGDRRQGNDKWDFYLDRRRQIAYIRLSAFSRETAQELRDALKSLTDQGLKGLVLDLRFNPGGLLSSAIEISDLFLSDGVIVSTEGRNVKRREWRAHKPGTFDGFPMVVLINRYSASASEILAAALQDHGRATVIGERTWGKGSVQNVIELENGKSALKLTTAAYQRPSGKPIHRFPNAKDWGVSPTDGYELKLPDGDIAAYLRYRRARDIVGATLAPPAKLPEGAPPEPPVKAEGDSFVDAQLQKAMDYLSTELARAK